MVAARAQVAPNMSETQAKLMQYLPVVFAVFLVFYLTGLVIYYMAQAIFRIGLQYYITHRFYKGEHSLGRQAQAAGERAREIAKKDGGGGGLFAQAKRQISEAKQPPAKQAGAKPPTVSKRVTPPKNRPTTQRQQQPSGLDRQVGTAQQRTSQEEVGPPWNGSNSPHGHSKRPRTWPSIGLGVAADDAEFEVLAEPKPGLFGRLRGEARVRARVRPAQARQKVDRRERRPRKSRGWRRRTASCRSRRAQPRRSSRPSHASVRGDRRRPRRRGHGIDVARSDPTDSQTREQQDVNARQVGDEARKFIDELVAAFAFTGTTELIEDGDDLEVRVHGENLGLLVGPRGTTLAGRAGSCQGRITASPRRSRHPPARRHRWISPAAQGSPRPLRGADGR